MDWTSNSNRSVDLCFGYRSYVGHPKVGSENLYTYLINLLNWRSLFQSLFRVYYRIYPKYWDTLTIYDTCPNCWNSPFWYLFLCLKYCCVCKANSVDPDQMPHSVASDLGLHCLQKPICPSTYSYYGIILPFLRIFKVGRPVSSLHTFIASCKRVTIFTFSIGTPQLLTILIIVIKFEQV